VRDEGHPSLTSAAPYQADILPEEWGGEVPMIPISAKTGEGVEALLETVSLVAEVTDILAQPDRVAAGTVIEAHLDRCKGPIATLLVQNGTLRVGDFTVAGAAFGKVGILAFMHSVSIQPMSSPHMFQVGFLLRSVFSLQLEFRWPSHFLFLVVGGHPSSKLIWNPPRHTRSVFEKDFSVCIR
jgi:hypothetical protein